MAIFKLVLRYFKPFRIVVDLCITQGTEIFKIVLDLCLTQGTPKNKPKKTPL
ncbi:hypothetical protein GCM10011384_07630 [Psychrobacillus lasiicapitis]|nr:hypothetical protein GCM10011384_07630 [Psychrobacillus lasiicapitis]